MCVAVALIGKVRIDRLIFILAPTKRDCKSISNEVIGGDPLKY